jgi:hypothetical protein
MKKLKILTFIPILVTLFVGVFILSNIKNERGQAPIAVEENYVYNMNALMEFIQAFDGTDTIFNAKAVLRKLVEDFDKNYGVAAGLYTREEDTIYVIDKIPDIDCPGIPTDFWRTELYEWDSSNYVIKTYTFVSDIIAPNTLHKFFYMTYKDYIVIWGVRPDYVNTYFISHANLLIRITLCLFIIIISNVVSLIIKIKHIEKTS